MLEECGLPYVVRPVDISKGEQFAAQFLAISPNNRMPAIVDPSGPGGRPISVFESGAILQYLGRKTGKVLSARGARPRRRRGVAVSGRSAGSARWPGRRSTSAATRRRQIVYAIARYTDEVNRLYGVMNKRLASARISGRPLFDRRYGLRRLGAARRAARPRPRAISRISSAGSKPSARGRRSSAPSPSVSRRRPRSTCAIRKCARCCSGSARR